MPYAKIEDLPQAVLDKYESDVKRRAFMQAFNSSYDSCDEPDKSKCEQRAFAIAHSAAQKAGESRKQLDSKELDLRIAQELSQWLTEREGEYIDDITTPSCERCQAESTADAPLTLLGGMLLCEDCAAAMVKDVVIRYDDLLKAHYAPEVEIEDSENGVEIEDKGLFKRFRRAKRSQIIANAKSDDTIDVTDAAQGFKVLPGRKWVAWYTNDLVDREAERFDLKAIENDIAYQNATGNLPELWYYHIPGTRHGKAIKTLLVGNMAMAIGTFDDTPFADQMIVYYEKSKNIAVSHGYVYYPEDKQEGVYKRFHTFEVSALPRAKEANPFTRFIPIQKELDMPVPNEAIQALAAIVGEQKAQEILAQAPTVVNDLKAITDYKAEKPMTDEEKAAEDEKKRKEAMMQKSASTDTPDGSLTEAFKAFSEQMVANLATNQAAIGDLVASIKALHERLVSVEALMIQRKAQQPRIQNLPQNPSNAPNTAGLLADMQSYSGAYGDKAADVTPLGVVQSLLGGKK